MKQEIERLSWLFCEFPTIFSYCQHLKFHKNNFTCLVKKRNGFLTFSYAFSLKTRHQCQFQEMALLPKKTYSKRDNEVSALNEKEKENIDPFDELLSSPLKQDVQFQPLSFWGKKVKDQEAKKKANTLKCGLYEISDSDELSSPFQRKRKPKTKHSISKTALQPKSANKLCTRRYKSNSAAQSLIKRTKSHYSVIPVERKNSVHNEEYEKNKNKGSDKTFYFNDNMEETLKPTNKNYNNFKCNNTSHFNLNETNGNFDSCPQSEKCKRSDDKNSNKFINQEIFNSKNLNFKIYEDFGSPIQQSNSVNDKTFLINKESLNSTKNFSETMEETLTPFHKHSDSYKFISVKRNFNYPGCCNLLDGSLSCSSDSIGFSENDIFSNFWNVPKTSCVSSHSNVKIYEDTCVAADCLTENTNLIYDDESFINNSLVQSCSENMDKTLCSVNFTNTVTEESETVQECQSESTITDSFDFFYYNNTKLEDLIEELLEQQNANEKNSVTVDSGLSSSSDDTASEPNDEDTVIRIGPEPEKSFDLSKGTGNEETKCEERNKNGVSQLTSGISVLTISNTTDDEISKPKAGKSSKLQKDFKCADKEDSFLIDLRNVTTKRRGFLNNRYGKNIYQANDRRSSIAPKKNQTGNNSETEFEFDQTLEISQITDRLSLDWNKTISFANPIFESTRVFDMSPKGKKVPQEQQTNLTETIFEESGLNHTYALKPGKKWFRSMSVLKQLQNGDISGGRLESTRITGRKFESFVQDVVEMQNASSKVSNKTVLEASAQDSFPHDPRECKKVSNVENSVLGESETSEFFSITDPILAKSVADKTTSEKLLLNYTVKVIHSEESSSAFKSALGLETSQAVIQEDSIKEESSCVSAKDFILMQCGQNDVVPFEEYFNERTLINCKKIGEGVYGEVFMCSDTVIKIIPIEGLDKVNGEPQKTFEEIISEVVIASKLSNLRKGEKQRTDGFSEMKRCWCVKGKYPKYLLDLWNEYDQLGSGSENDSPIMFKDDQLYIILELANGGKDLESFVFNSASQSLSIFIQAAFSLAAAEKAFEFEHRDLHWGNVLISETKEKFMTVVLDSTEYKIPTKGVKVCIIDFTLSRINHEGCCIFNDLSVDPGLFASEGDYQFEIYRMMLKEVNNDWSLFRPRNNIFWLHYMIDKMIKMVRYKNKKAKLHTKHIKDLKTLESVVLEHKDSTEFVLSSSFSAMMDKL